MQVVKKTIALLLLCGVLCGCSYEVRAEPIPAANYISPAETQIVTILTAETTEGVMASALTTTEAVPETTAAETSATEAATAISADIVSTTRPPLSSAGKKYTNTITLNGPNLVYTGESFDFTYVISHRNANRASVLWQCSGDAGEISDEGHFTAKKAGKVELSVSDISNGLTDTLIVHVADSPQDVDFVVEVNGIPIANKTYPVPRNYSPGLLTEVYDAFLELKLAALEDDAEINFMSGFRSYAEQIEVHRNWEEFYPDGEADRVSAQAGYSEHQLGVAIDVNSIDASFAKTEEGVWLAENCWKYGFIIRYPMEKEKITGYMYEPWHIRYLGKDLAKEVHFSGLTLEEYLGIDSRYRIELVKAEE